MENIEVESGAINILGVLGNFFARFLNEAGVEGKSISDLSNTIFLVYLLLTAISKMKMDEIKRQHIIILPQD